MGHFGKQSQTPQIRLTPVYREIDPHMFNNVDGVQKAITMINICSCFDNLINTVDFTYTLYYSDYKAAIRGKYTLDHDEYNNWDSSEAMAYSIVCAALNIKLKEI